MSFGVTSSGRPAPVDETRAVEAAAPSRATLAEASLEELLALALESHPELDAAQREVAARQADARQAARRRNPQLGLDVEDFAGSGVLSGLDQAQTTLSLTQYVERGGKRGAREDLARLDTQLASQDGELLIRDLTTRISAGYWRALLAQGELELATSIEATTNGFLEAVRERVAAGKVSAVEEAKYAVALASAKLDRRDARRAHDQALRELERIVGLELRIDTLSGEFGAALEPPTLAELQHLMRSSPRQARLSLDEDRAHAQLELARSASVVDFQFNVGLRRFEASDDLAAVVGVGVPLPVFNSGRDAREAARERVQRAASLRRGRELQLQSTLEKSWSRLVGAHADLRALEEGVLRDSAWVSSAVDEGYREGKFELLDALDAQRTDFEVRARHLRALADYHLALTSIESLLCRSIQE